MWLGHLKKNLNNLGRYNLRRYSNYQVTEYLKIQKIHEILNILSLKRQILYFIFVKRNTHTLINNSRTWLFFFFFFVNDRLLLLLKKQKWWILTGRVCVYYIDKESLSMSYKHVLSLKRSYLGIYFYIVRSNVIVIWLSELGRLLNLEKWILRYWIPCHMSHQKWIAEGKPMPNNSKDTPIDCEAVQCSVQLGWAIKLEYVASVEFIWSPKLCKAWQNGAIIFF